MSLAPAKARVLRTTTKSPPLHQGIKMEPTQPTTRFKKMTIHKKETPWQTYLESPSVRIQIRALNISLLIFRYNNILIFRVSTFPISLISNKYNLSQRFC